MTPYVAYASLVPVILLPRDTVEAKLWAIGVALVSLQLLGLVTSLVAAFHPRLGRRTRRPWRFIAGSFALLLVAGIGFTVGSAGGESAAGVAVGVACRLLLIPVLLAGLLTIPMNPMTRRARYKLILDTTTVIGGGFMLIWYLFLSQAITDQNANRSMLALPVGDLVLIFGVCTVLVRGVAATFLRPVVMLLGGSALYLISDTLLAYQIVFNRLPPTAPMPDWLVLALASAIFLIGAAAAEQCRQTGVDQPGGPAQPQVRLTTPLPYFALAIGYGILVTAAVRDREPAWVGLVAGAVLMTFGVATRQVVALRENHELVVSDSLTGLANRLQLRQSLNRTLERNRRTGKPTAVLLIDLDGFKQINDRFGHETGDKVLIEYAGILARNVRQVDTAARLGGDEFAVVLDGAAAADAIGVADRIIDSAATSPEFSGREFRIRASVGIAVTDSEPCLPHELLHRADMAMYAAKRQHHHSWYLHTEGLLAEEVANTDEAALVEDLELAVEAGQLHLVYQPIVDLITGEMTAVEALVRWRHPTRGPLSPQAFIPLAEKGAAIHQIGAWVLAQACRQLRRWQTTLVAGQKLRLHVNVSPKELDRDSFATDVLAVLQRTGVEPALLVLEVTEGALVNHLPATTQLTAVHEQGVRIALDDFGTGYSSLRYLTQFPVDLLKLDRCFVTELNGSPQGAAVAQAVLRLGQALDLETVAEGIEEPAQAAELVQLGYRVGQGFHFSTPLDPEAVAAHLTEPFDRPALVGPRQP